MEHTYADRNRTLRSLGFASYHEYLSSPLWSSIKEEALATHGHQCRLCRKPTSILHHLGYGRRVLTGREIHQLVPVCSGCHTLIEFKGDGTKRTLLEAHSAFVRLWKVAKRKIPKEKAERRGFPGYCTGCGNKAKKRSKYCRVCIKEGRKQ